MNSEIGLVDKLRGRLNVFFLEHFSFLQRFFISKNFPKDRYNLEFALIAGCPRSGTNLLTSLIETNDSVWVGNTEMDFSSRNIEKNLKSVFGEHAGVDFEESMNSIDDKHIVLRRPTILDQIDLMLRKFPRMKVILIFRDGRDTVVSLNKIFHFRWPINFGSKKWRNWVLARKKIPRSRLLTIRYEDLVDNASGEVNRIFDFLGVKRLANKKILDFYKSRNQKKYHAETRGQPVNRNKVARWKKEMNGKDVETFKRIAGDALIEMGYEKNREW